MIGTTAAVLGAAAIGGAASLASGAMGASAANSAANAQSASADKSLALQASMYAQNRQDAMPWMDAGKAALSQYMGELGISMPAANSSQAPSAASNPAAQSGFGAQQSSTVRGKSMNPRGVSAAEQPSAAPPAGFDADYYLRANPDVAASAKYGGNPYQHYVDWGKAEGRTIVDPSAQPAANTPATPFKSGFRETPGYQFQVSEGEKGVVNNMAALGMKNSGAALKALTRFRTGLADQTYNTYLDRLSGMAGAGAATTANQGQLGASSAVNQGQTISDAGAARASGYVGGANAWQNALGSFSNTAGNALGWAA